MADKILVVDDSSSMRQMIKFSLMEEGYDVTEAVDGEDGLKKLEAMDECLLIFSDINMPNMNGIEFIKNVRAGSKFKFVPIVILTTESETSKRQEGSSAGATAWMVKPFTPEQLTNVIKKVTD